MLIDSYRSNSKKIRFTHRIRANKSRLLHLCLCTILFSLPAANSEGNEESQNPRLKTTIQTAWAYKAQAYFGKINNLKMAFAVLSQGGWADRGQLLAYQTETEPEIRVAFAGIGEPAKELDHLEWRRLPAEKWLESLRMLCRGSPKTRKGLDHLVYECIQWKRANSKELIVADQQFYDSPTPKQDYPKEFKGINQLFGLFVEQQLKPTVPKNAPVMKKERKEE